MITLKKNQRLIYVGDAELRAPNGALLPAVPQFTIVSVEEDDADHIVHLKSNERLMLAGHIFKDRAKAEERFAALKAGREQPPRETGTPLYIVEDVENFNPKTGLTPDEESSIRAFSKELAGIFAIHMRGAEKNKNK